MMATLVAPAANTAGAVSSVMPPIATTGNPRDRLHGLGDQADAHLLVPGLLCPCWKHRADSDVAHGLERRVIDLIDRVRRIADDGLAGRAGHGPLTQEGRPARRARRRRPTSVPDRLDRSHDERAVAAGGGDDLVTQIEESIGREHLSPAVECNGRRRRGRHAPARPAASLPGVTRRRRRWRGAEGAACQAVSARLLFLGCGMKRSMKDVLNRPA